MRVQTRLITCIILTLFNIGYLRAADADAENKSTIETSDFNGFVCLKVFNKDNVNVRSVNINISSIMQISKSENATKLMLSYWNYGEMVLIQNKDMTYKEVVSVINNAHGKKE